MIQDDLSDDDCICSYRKTPNGKKFSVTNKLALKFLRAHVQSEESHEALGLKISQIGLDSLRASSAMAMFLNRIPVATIMLLGRCGRGL